MGRSSKEAQRRWAVKRARVLKPYASLNSRHCPSARDAAARFSENLSHCSRIRWGKASLQPAHHVAYKVLCGTLWLTTHTAEADKVQRSLWYTTPPTLAVADKV